MEFLTVTFIIVSIIFMCVFMFIGIWSFIIYLKSYRQKRYQNYILEKITQQLSLISNKMDSTEYSNRYDYLTGEEDFEFNSVNDDKLNNITDFNKQENYQNKSL